MSARLRARITLATLAGLVFAARLNTATPKAGTGFELDVIAAVDVELRDGSGDLGSDAGLVAGEEGAVAGRVCAKSGCGNASAFYAVRLPCADSEPVPSREERQVSVQGEDACACCRGIC